MSFPKKIPQTASEWSKIADQVVSADDLRQGLRGSTWNSASKMTFEQFLVLRTCWQTRGIEQFQLDHFVDANFAQAAKGIVDSVGHDYYTEYFKTLESRVAVGFGASTRCAPPSSGPFALVLHQQDQVTDKQVPPGDGNTKVIISPRYFTRSKAATVAQRVLAEVSPTPAGRADPDDNTLSTSLAKMNLNKPGTPPNSTAIQPSLVRTPDSPEPASTDPGESPESTDTRLSAFSQFSPEQVRAASDEQIVNAALVSFLQATTMYWCSTLEWSLHRNILKMSDLYEARTDGCLWTRGKEKRPLVILETKAHVRKANDKQIMIQETAQMAAWIRQDKTGAFSGRSESDELDTRRRLLIAQDSREIYVTIGEYDSRYEDYLIKTSESQDPFDKSVHQFDHTANGPFLNMTCYGPFDIHLASHMKLLAIAVIAFTKAFAG